MGHVRGISELSIRNPEVIDMEVATKKSVSRAEQAELLATHDKAIERMARRYSSSIAPTQDLIQEGRLALLRAAETFDASRGVPLIGYAWRFISSAMLRFVNCELSERVSRSDEGLVALIAGDGPSPEDEAGDAEMIDCLHEAMQDLTEEDRKILSLFYFQGKGLKPIAEELGVSAAWAHRLFHAAIAILANRLEARL